MSELTFIKKLCSSDFSIKDKHRSGRPKKVADVQIKAIIDSNRLIPVRKIAKNLQHTII